MLGTFGTVYLLDWGIALQTDQIDRYPNRIVGTPSYMAPEMLSGNLEDIGVRTDVFLVGACLHEIVFYDRGGAQK